MKREAVNVNAQNIQLNYNQRETVAGVTTEYPYSMHIADFKAGPIPWHWHEEIEFGYVLNGQIEITLANRTYIVQKNHGYFTNSNVLSRFSKATDTVLAHTHLFHPIFLSGHFKSIFETKYLDPVIHNKNIDALIFTGKTPNQQKILQKLRQASALQHQENVEFQTRNLFSELWLLLLEEIKEQPTHTVNFQNQERVQNMLTFIHAHYSEKLTLNDIAAAASVSTRECIRCFRNTIRQTPLEYVMEYRLNMAKRLLDDTEISITEVSYHCGFSSNAYFGKIFREKCGMTPLQYRNRNIDKRDVLN
ncbi:AraC family transcriptional regulator [Blautia sp. MSJ-19]|uniref:AraC family transcriptional regulator n=1 Tax=Blautia sp. MSJ-19 TaxID=2841517 RepID=UPI001C0EDB12|nr:AraC family transcriptional regulator [Blautia sp. MSJ-19]MBU5481887.1 AraC family transcriptional regulator [Blautia sp. MSJ-19]